MQIPFLISTSHALSPHPDHDTGTDFFNSESDKVTILFESPRWFVLSKRITAKVSTRACKVLWPSVSSDFTCYHVSLPHSTLTIPGLSLTEDMLPGPQGLFTSCSLFCGNIFPKRSPLWKLQHSSLPSSVPHSLYSIWFFSNSQYLVGNCVINLLMKMTCIRHSVDIHWKVALNNYMKRLWYNHTR